MKADLSLLKTLREDTNAGVSDCRKALEETDNNMAKAKALILEWGIAKAEKKEGKETSQGVVEAYVHGGKVGVLVELRCETDFVARTDQFKELAHEIALQVAAMNPKDTKELLESVYIRDAKLTIAALMKLTIAKVGENITVAKFTRLALGQE